MTFWRDSTSREAQNDLDELLSASLGFAQQQLADYGEFFPYSVVVGVDGQAEMIAARPDDDRPASADIIASCRTFITERRDQLRAAAIIADVRVADLGGDAIRVDLEHAEGPALTVQLPYTKNSGNIIDYGQLRASSGTRTIWPG
ncbi:MAG: hypothetical protein ACRDR6_10070 [Pseudonocardiaceae bacterium]